ncbi:MAG: DUF2249 domain-containing protein, partial [Thiobacillus sp.]
MFGALDALNSGERMRFVNDHDPLPLLDQLRARAARAADSYSAKPWPRLTRARVASKDDCRPSSSHTSWPRSRYSASRSSTGGGTQSGRVPIDSPITSGEARALSYSARSS